MISLKNADKKKKCRILEMNVNNLILRRFLDIGIMSDAIIEKILISPFGGISAYSIMGTTIAIRDKDIEGVMVEYE